MSTSSTSIKFVLGTDKHLAYYAHGTSLSRIKNFAYAIQPFTNAEIRHVAVTIGDDMTIPAKGGAIETVELFAKLLIKHPASGKTYGIIIPAPVLSMFDEGNEVLSSVGEQITNYYEALAGETFVFTSGALCGATNRV